ncbi:unnamed protein product [Adineta steineri]|uniref:SCP domain-containing protein n=2 Tax=Adineta steineri TaxID=433720 RepID=A0A814AHS4_9BILA|nr:unnamed protein product [Adineta steineri]
MASPFIDNVVYNTCFIISLLCVFLNGNPYDDNELHRLTQRSSSSSFTSDQRKVQKKVLHAHNTYRSEHCTPSLKLDDDLNHSAQKYAEELAKTNTFDHSDLYHLGENLFKMSSNLKIDDFDEPAAQAVRGWYDEISKYDFDDPKFTEEAGHFTQLLWKDSKKLGVGFATGKHKSKHTLYIVAHYSPAGNVDELFSENVLSADEC